MYVHLLQTNIKVPVYYTYCTVVTGPYGASVRVRLWTQHNVKRTSLQCNFVVQWQMDNRCAGAKVGMDGKGKAGSVPHVVGPTSFSFLLH